MVAQLCQCRRGLAWKIVWWCIPTNMHPACRGHRCRHAGHWQTFWGSNSWLCWLEMLLWELILVALLQFSLLLHRCVLADCPHCMAITPSNKVWTHQSFRQEVCKYWFHTWICSFKYNTNVRSIVKLHFTRKCGVDTLPVTQYTLLQHQEQNGPEELAR